MMDLNSKTVVFGEKAYTLDEHGYLDPVDQWDENFVDGMAEKLEILSGVTDEHWQIIHYLRDKFNEGREIPLVVFACIDNKIRLSKLKSLFPTGYLRGACRISGINYAFLFESNILLTYEDYSTLATQYNITDTGFLNNFETWDKRFAALVARDWKLTEGLTDKHLEVIEYLREYYRRLKNVPTVYEACKSNEIEIEELHRLFPDGYRRGACRAAGLPFFS